MIGINARGTMVLCYAWGESDVPEVALVEDLVELRTFLEKTYSEDEAHVSEIVHELDCHDWEEGAVAKLFEMGGLQFSDVTQVEVF